MRLFVDRPKFQESVSYITITKTDCSYVVATLTLSQSRKSLLQTPNLYPSSFLAVNQTSASYISGSESGSKELVENKNLGGATLPTSLYVNQFIGHRYTHQRMAPQ